MDISSQFAAFLERERVQAASVASLSSQVAELTSTVARLSADNAAQAASIASLSSENADLKRVVADVSRLGVPGGHWIWESASATSKEAGERGGRWVWSLEKYKPASSVAVRSGAPASLLALPVELKREIVELLPRTDQIQLCFVCFDLLELLSNILDDDPIIDHADGMVTDFICKRLEQPSTKSVRITPLLIPSLLHFGGIAPKDLVETIDRRLETNPDGILMVQSLILSLPSIEHLAPWSPILSRLDPTSVSLIIGSDDSASDGSSLDDPPAHPPTIHRLPSLASLDFAASWTRLEQVNALGPGSVLLSPGGVTRLAFGDCLRRNARLNDETTEVVTKLQFQVDDEFVESETVHEEHLEKLLGPDPTRSEEADGFMLIARIRCKA